MFAADLYDVKMGTAKSVYRDPKEFFTLTFPSSGIRALARDVAYRLAGKSDKAVRQLSLTYGGGKTHALITEYHLHNDPAKLPDMPAVAEFRAEMGGLAIPKARIVVLPESAQLEEIPASLLTPEALPELWPASKRITVSGAVNYFTGSKYVTTKRMAADGRFRAVAVPAELTRGRPSRAGGKGDFDRSLPFTVCGWAYLPRTQPIQASGPDARSPVPAQFKGRANSPSTGEYTTMIRRNIETAIKLAVDKDRAPGRFLLTGSANVMTLPPLSESLAGRMEVVPFGDKLWLAPMPTLWMD
jgi:hypothetical protein